MSRQASALANEFASHLRALEGTRKKTELLASQGELVRRDIEKVYEALYLRSFTHFEAFLEDLFIGMLSGRIASPSFDVIPRVEFKSDVVARDIVFGGRNYVDWVPFDRTEQRAKVFFRGGRPFTNLEKPDVKGIELLYKIRNAIAHQSAHSKRLFLRDVVGDLPLTSNEKTPAGFLRSQFRISPTQTRFELYAGMLVNLARKICN